MSRLTRRTVILVGLEASYGAGMPAEIIPLLVEDPDFQIDRDLVPRTLVRQYLGGAEHLIGTRRAIVKFKTELQGAGVADTPPAWGALMRACGLAQTITTTAGEKRVTYSPISTGFESLCIHFYRDGVRYNTRGVRGTVKLDLTAYQRPMAEWEFWGFDTAASEVAVPTDTSFAAWKRPVIITDANSGDIRVGCTLNLGEPAGGTVMSSRGMTVDIGNKLSHLKLLGGEEISITDRDITGQMTVAMTAADEVTWRTDINTNTLTSVGLRVGNTSGYRVRTFGGAVQRVNPQAVDYEGRLMIQSDLRFLPSAGNDDILIMAA